MCFSSDSRKSTAQWSVSVDRRRQRCYVDPFVVGVRMSSEMNSSGKLIYRPGGTAIHCLKNGQVASFPMIFPTPEMKTSTKFVSIDPSAEISYCRLETIHSRCANDCICVCKLCLIECFRLVTFTWRQRRQKHEHFMHICSIDGAESVKNVLCQVCNRQKREKKVD